MRKKLLSIVALCAACVVWQAQGQGSTEPSTGNSTSSGNPGASGGSSQNYGGSSSRQAGWQGMHHRMGAMSGPEQRASQLTGAQVNGASGQTLGTINDVLINPASGRIDFAVISLNASAETGAAGTPATAGAPGSTSTSGATSSTSTSGEKLVAVPWPLLRPSSAAGATSTTVTSGTAGAQTTFVFAGDTSKLQSAPSFSQANWPDISQPSWRHSIFSYFGMTPGAATGAAESPGGTSGSSSSYPGSSGSQGSSSTPGSSTGR